MTDEPDTEAAKAEYIREKRLSDLRARWAKMTPMERTIERGRLRDSAPEVKAAFVLLYAGTVDGPSLRRVDRNRKL